MYSAHLWFANLVTPSTLIGGVAFIGLMAFIPLMMATMLWRYPTDYKSPAGPWERAAQVLCVLSLIVFVVAGIASHIV